ncbi:hypothetical protein B0J17DRAFT_322200 [Rhizoctonia solani]|nr:hypothetical protein B0J17DRAFT_322200 [Rhizoctonia solani]
MSGDSVYFRRAYEHVYHHTIEFVSYTLILFDRVPPYDHPNALQVAPIQLHAEPSFGRFFPSNTTLPMPLDSRAAYQDWGDDEDEDSMSAVKWASPAPNAVLVSGGKLVATWSTPARPVASPSFQLCLVETEECGDTIWPKVKKLSGGQYTITLKVPQLGSDNDFFVRMVDDKGTVYDTPEFKLQGSESPNAALALNSGSSSSPSVLPDSLTSSLPGSGLPGSTLSGVGHEGSNGDGSNGSGPYSSGSERGARGDPNLIMEGPTGRPQRMQGNQDPWLMEQLLRAYLEIRRLPLPVLFPVRPSPPRSQKTLS